MISQGQFIDAMDRIEAGHQRKMQKRTKDIWYEDCGEWDKDAFFYAIDRLRRAEKWPNWNAVVYQYNDALRHLGLAKQKKFCGYCKDGWLFYFKEVYGKDYDYAAPCARCYPNEKDRMNPGKPRVRFISDFRKDNLSRRKYSVEECRENWREIFDMLRTLGGPTVKRDESARRQNIAEDKARATA